MNNPGGNAHQTKDLTMTTASAQHIANQTARYNAAMAAAMECWCQLTGQANSLDHDAAQHAMDGLDYAETAIEEAQNTVQAIRAAKLVGRFDTVVLGHVQGWDVTGE